MSRKMVNIDVTWFPSRLRKYADKLDEDFYDNIIDVIGDLTFQLSSVTEKIKGLERELIQKHLKEYMVNRIKEKQNEEVNVSD